MTDTTPATQDPDFDLVENLFTLHPPKNDAVADLMGSFRGDLKDLAFRVVDELPRTPDRTVALRKIHEASMAVIGAIACNQDGL